MNSDVHVSVFLNDAIEALQIKPNGIYADCTLGRGGHAQVILKHLNNDGKLLALDCDLDAIKYAQQLFNNDSKIAIIHSKFSQLNNVLEQYHLKSIDGYLFDLGLSSPQLDNKERGFSYHGDDILDMRMDQTQAVDAKNVINSYTVEQLIEIFKTYGECKHAHFVAKNIIKSRMVKPIETTGQLVDIIKQALPNEELHKHKHPARTYFQAIRIEVNQEFKEIESGLNAAIQHLNNHGRVVVITFHSLEDNLVRKIFKQYITSKLPNYLPLTASENTIEYRTIKNTVNLELEEKNNARARSARMHIIERNLYE